MARASVRDVSGPSEIRGVAAPVNTYVRPADPAPSGLHQLAEGLSALGGGLSAFMEKRKVASDEADKQKAIKDAYMSNGAGFDEGVKQGLIPPQNSPTYMEWYKKGQGDVQGRKLRDQFAIKYQTWEGRASGDPAAFQEFLGGFLAENIGEVSDPQVLAGLNPHIEKMFDEGYSAFNTDRSAAIKNGGISTSGAKLTDDIERAEEDARANGEEIDHEALWGTIMAERDEATKRIMPSDYDPVLVDAIILQAEEAGDEDLLLLLDRTLPGAEHPMSHDLKVRDKRNASIARIQSAQASMATTRAAAEEKADKERHNALVGDTYRQIAADPNYEVPEDVIKDLSRRDPEFRGKLAAIRKSMVGSGIPENPDEIVQVMADIAQGADENYVLNKFRQGVIKDAETLNKALDRVKATTNASKPGGIMDSVAYKNTIKQITNKTGEGELSFLDGVRGLSDDGARAQYDYLNQLLDWEAANPKASLQEREKAAREIGLEVLSSIIPDPTQTQQGIYKPQDATQPEAAPSAQPTGVTSPAAVPEPVEAPPSQTQGQAPAAGTESPAMTAAIEQLSKKHGVPPEVARQILLEEDAPVEEPAAAEEVVEPEVVLPSAEDLEDGFEPVLEEDADAEPGMWENLSKPRTPISNFFGWLTGTGGDEAEPKVDPEVTNAIPEADRTRLQELLKNPPKLGDGKTSAAGNTPVGPLLDLIGNTEGTDKGDGYNETLGYGAYTGGDVDLVGMTLDEVDAMQTRMLRHPGNKWNSSASGRYQIIRTTLRGLRKELGLKGTEKFDAKMQDRLALHLLERRGLSKWQAGEISDKQFIRGLSSEWASLPKSDGKGTYAGQRVGTTVEGLTGVLGQVRSGGTQVASLDPAAGLGPAIPEAYAKIPSQDSRGEDQVSKFMEWNADPVANHEANLKTLKPTLQSVIKRAQEIGGVKFVIGSGKRDAGLQKKAVEWGWSKTEDSDHIHGDAVDLWPLDDDGAVVFDKKQQLAIVANMKAAAKELGITLDIGADWKSFKDPPHFAIKS